MKQGARGDRQTAGRLTPSRMIRISTQGLPWQPSGWDSSLPLQGVQARSLVGELRSCKPCGAAKKNKEYPQTSGQVLCHVCLPFLTVTSHLYKCEPRGSESHRPCPRVQRVKMGPGLIPGILWLNTVL